MLEDNVFTPPAAVCENLCAVSKKQSVLDELRICELSELVNSALDFSDLMLRAELDVYEILSLISEGVAQGSLGIASHDIPLPENVSRLAFRRTVTDNSDKALFAEMYVTAALARGISVTEKTLLPTANAAPTFIYVRNAFSDEAYDVFSQDYNNPTVRYAKSFKEAVKAVTEGEVTYCLLPLEERGSRIATISELIVGNDLKINSVTPVFGFDGVADMKYALVSTAYTVPEVREGDDRYLEIRIKLDGTLSLDSLLYAAASYGLGVYRINTHNTANAESYASLVFRDGGGGFTSLLVYLTLFSPAYVAVGMYKNLE